MDRSGFSIIEIAMVLVILVALAPPLIGSAGELRRSFLLSRAREDAARLFAEGAMGGCRGGWGGRDPQCRPAVGCRGDRRWAIRRG